MNGLNLDLKVDNPEQRIVLSIQSSTEMHTKTWKNAFIAAMECGRFIEWLEIPWAGPPGLEDCKLYQDTCLEIQDKATAELFQQIYLRQGHKLLKTHNLVNVDLCSLSRALQHPILSYYYILTSPSNCSKTIFSGDHAGWRWWLRSPQVVGDSVQLFISIAA